MAIVVVGGGGRGVGKTSLVCAMISGLPEFHWVAAKVTTHAHGMPQAIYQELNPGQEKDTARYLTAGASGSFLLPSPPEQESDTALFDLWLTRFGKENVIFESNRILNFIKPDLCLAVAAGADDKTSFKTAIQNADAIVVGPNARALLQSHGKITRPIFELENIGRLTPELADWIRNWLRYL
jgi:hypothetical protein